MSTFSIGTSQSTNKMAAIGGQLNLAICDVWMIFNVKAGNAIKIFDAGGEGDAGGS